MELTILKDIYSIYRFNKGDILPEWVYKSDFHCVTETKDELSVVTAVKQEYINVKSDHGWKILRIAGPLDFSLIGIIAELAGILRDEKIPVFVISTFDTDYILVREENLPDSCIALERRDHRVLREE